MCEENLIESECFEYQGFKVVIRYDEFSESPIDLSSFTLVSYCDLADSELEVAIAEKFGGYVKTKKAAIQYLENEVIYLPVYKYEHNIVAYSTVPFSDSWKSGKYGVIAITRNHARDLFKVKRITADLEQRIAYRMKTAVREYTAWANGWVYEFEILDKHGNCIDEYCGGFLDMDICKGVAKDTINRIINRKNHAWHERLKELIQKHVPLFNRMRIRKTMLEKGIC